MTSTGGKVDSINTLVGKMERRLAKLNNKKFKREGAQFVVWGIHDLRNEFERGVESHSSRREGGEEAVRRVERGAYDDRN